MRSFACEDLKPLIVCRGPIRKEAMDVFEEMGISHYGILLSEKDSIVYANALARHIAASDPKIRKVFDQWRNTPALDSPLTKNQDLKSVLLEETPWVREAKDESAARRNVGLLFDANRLDDETPDKTVVVKGDRRLKYKDVRKVMQLLNEAGFSRVGVVAEKEKTAGGA